MALPGGEAKEWDRIITKSWIREAGSRANSVNVTETSPKVI
jgi:hypothetical protein